MKDYIENRTLGEAEYIVDKQSTLRQTAHEFGVSKSTTHRDLVERLDELDSNLSQRVRNVINSNLEDRAYRGAKARWNLEDK